MPKDEEDSAQASLTQEEAEAVLREREAQIKEHLPKMEAAVVGLQVPSGNGSGVVVSEDGLILSAAHVVAGQPEMTVRFADGRLAVAKVLGAYAPGDAAMLKIIDPGSYEYVEMAKSGDLQEGDSIFALGNPSGFDEQRGMPLRVGHVIRIDEITYQTDAPLVSGDSGGPSFNSQGLLVGIHSNVNVRMEVNNDVRIDIFHREWKSLLAGEIRGTQMLRPENPNEARANTLVFGALLVQTNLNEGGKPIRIESIEPGTPAEWAGLEPGDLIELVNGEPVPHTWAFQKSLLDKDYGMTCDFAVIRGTERFKIPLTLMTMGEIEAQRKKGAPEKPTLEKLPDAQPEPTPTETAKTQDEVEHQTEIEKLLEQSRSNKGRLDINPDKLRDLYQRLSSRVNRMSPLGGRQSGAWGQVYKTAFAEHLEKYHKSTFAVHANGKHATLATLVDPRGYFISKASEIAGRDAAIILSEDLRAPIQFITSDYDTDIAILKVSPNFLQQVPHIPVNLTASANRSSAPKGTICYAVGDRSDTLNGHGVVSVAERPLNGNTTAFLGALGLDLEEGEGAVLAIVDARSPAESAGLLEDDIVESVNEQIIKNGFHLTDVVETHPPNSIVNFNLKRGDSWLTVPVRLGDLSGVIPMPGATLQEVDEQSTPTNRRRWGFSSGIQVDCSFRPKDTGGPLIDLDGNFLGLNIARSGRVKSYAIPASVVAQFVVPAIEADLSNPPSTD